MDSLTRRQISRRGFLQGTLAATVAGAGLAIVGPGPSGGRERIRTLARDIRHDPAELARGVRQGTQLARVNEGDGLALQPGRRTGTYLSPIVRTELPFTHAGLHWLADYPTGSDILLDVRTSVDGDRWSPWRRLYVEAAAGQAARGETYGALISEDRGRYLQYRATLQKGEGGPPVIRYVTITLINTLDGSPLEPSTPDLSVSSALALAAVTKPVTFTREEWGADESLRFSGSSEVWPRMYVPTKKLVVHHTATGNFYASGAAVVRAIYYYHAVTLGWGDIGYNALIDRFGNSYEGRYGRVGSSLDHPTWGREILTAGVVAGHVLSYNYGSAGIAVIGDFQAGTPTSSAVAKLRALLALECRLHGINPKAASDFLRSDAVWDLGLINLCGHRDVGSTSCPGSNLYSQLSTLRNDVAASLADSSAPTVALTQGPHRQDVTGKATYQWSGTGSEYSYYLEGWDILSAGDLKYLKGYNGDKTPAWGGWTKDRSATFHHLKAGRYTVHIRASNALGQTSVFQDNRTFTTNGTHIFADVSGGHWAHGPIETLFLAGIASGCSIEPPLYCTKEPVSRAALAAFIIRSMNEDPVAAPKGTIFSDVPASHWAAGFIERLAQLGFTVGYPDGTYRPSNAASRAEIAILIARSLGETPLEHPTGTVFSDVPASYWAAGFIERVARLGVTVGYPDGTYHPTGSANRAETAVFVTRAWSLPSITRADMALFMLRGIGHDEHLPAYQGFFSDVPPGQWYTGYVEHLREHGITSGFADGTYRPKDPAGRAEIAVVIVRALGKTPLSPTGTVFSDVPASHWAAGYIERLAQLGITSGYSDGTFRPSREASRADMIAFVSRAWEVPWPPQYVTRADMALFILTALGQDDNLPPYQGYFSDVSEGQWYTGHVERLFELDITAGFSDGTYRPKDPASRAQIAVAIVRALGETPVAPTGTVFSDVNASHWAAGYIERLAQIGITGGYSDGTFRPSRATSQAEMVAFVSRAWSLS